MKTDYPELEGKEVKYYNGPEVLIGKVSGCNYHIGISIEDDDKYLLCLNGKSSPNFKKGDIHLPRHIYRKIFHLLVKQIQEGYINPSIPKIQNAAGDEIPTVDDCPYAQ